MPAGRPTEYKQKYCTDVIKFMSKGDSLTAFAASIDTWRQRLYEWADKHQEFADALKLAQAKCRAWWEAQGKNALTGKEINNAIWIFSMKSRFGASDAARGDGEKNLSGEYDDMYADDRKVSER